MGLSRVQKWVRTAFRRHPARPGRRPRGRPRLLLERLEDRAVPSTVTWINPSGGDWDAPGNWLDTTTGQNHVPGAADDAVIDTAGITVTHSSFFNSDTVQSLTSQAALAVSSGSLTFNAPSFTQSLSLTGGTVTVATPDPSNPGSLEVQDLTQSGGTLTGPGTVTVDSSLVWTGGTMSGSGTGAGHTAVLGTMEVGGGSPFGPTLSNRALDNFGAATLDNNSNLLFSTGAALNNQAGASLVLQGTGSLGNFFGNSGTLSNAGTLTHSGAANATSTVDLVFDNTGTVDVQAGTLNAKQGLTNEGGLTLEPGALATVNGGDSSGDFNLGAGSHLSVGGTFTLLAGSTTEVGAGGQLELDGNVTQQGGAAVTLGAGSLLNVGPGFSFGQSYLLADGAAVTGPGTVSLGGFSSQMTVSGSASVSNLTLSSGTLTLNPGASLEVGRLTQSGGTLTGPGTLTIDNRWDWTGGTMSGSGTGSGHTVNNGTAAVGSSFFGVTLSARAVDNGGTVTVPDNDAILFQNGAAWNNLAGGTLALGNGSALGSFFGSSGTLSNAGTLRRSGLASTTSTIDVPFDNTGKVVVQTGNLNVSQGLTNEGKFILKPGALATLTGGNSSGTIRLGAGSHLSVGGTFTLLAGSATHAGQGSQLELDGTVTQQGGAAVTLGAGSLLNVGPGFSFGGQNYVLADGAAVTGPGSVGLGGFSSQMTVAGSASVSNLSLSNGTLTLNPGASLTVHDLAQSGGTLTGAGALTITRQWTFTGGTMSGSGVNSGHTVVLGATEVGGGSPFGPTLSNRALDNFGAATLDSNSNLLLSANAAFTNQPGASLTLGNGSALGNFFGSSGTFTNAGLLTVSAGSASVGVGFTNSGTVTIGAGQTLSVGGNYTQTGGTTTVDGTLTLSSFFSNTVSLNGGVLNGAGTLNANVVNSAEVDPGDSPGILTINGNYTQTAAGTLVIEIGGLVAGAGYDRLAVSGTASLAGTLSVLLLNGFQPNPGDTFAVLTFASHTGDFTTENGLDLGNGESLTPSFNANGRELDLVAA